jgi:hypothetical protein
MKPLNNFSFLAILIMLSSCSPSLYYRPAVVQPDAADVIYTNGIPALRTSIQGCEVVAELTSKGERDMNLNLFIRNNSDSAFTFFPAAVEARGYNGAGQWSPYRVFEAEEYIRWKNNRDALISAGVMVATVATVVAIDRAINNGSPGNNVENLNSVAVGVDMVYNLTWWMAATIPAMTAEPPSPPAYSPDFLLRDHTLYPGEAVQGIVKVRAAQEFKNKILVEVPVNGAYAQFVFDRASAVR